MTKKTKRRRIFLETSGVYYQLHGHSLMQNAVRVANPLRVKTRTPFKYTWASSS
jgi:hypothetical protein